MKTIMTIETVNQQIIEPSQSREVSWCEECREDMPMISAREAAAILKLSEMAVFRLAEFGQIHSREDNSGMLLLCSNSVSNLAMSIGNMPGQEKFESCY